MIGQQVLDKPDVNSPLKRRVMIMNISAKDARPILLNYHYLHRARTGKQMHYAVVIDGVVDGVITYAYPMMSTPILGVPSDEMLEFARLFLFSNIPHTASCAIGKSLRVIKKDWIDRFPTSKEPKMIVSWSDKSMFSGTIYKAANFTHIGQTLDVRRTTIVRKNGFVGERGSYSDYRNPKDCWIYWLK
jgi:hypothetical protein